jgi:hypothetical protein
MNWYLNDVLLSAAAVKSMTVSFRKLSTSQVSFSQDELFDVAPALAYRAAVTIKRGETLETATRFFQGKVDRCNRAASPANEEHNFFIVDAWQDLEDTIYQESWRAGLTSLYLPEAVLGMSDTGAAINIGAQIAAAIDFAGTAGIDIVAGSLAAGNILWPQKVDNVSIAEVIRQSLKFYPDYVPWIDYAPTVPEFNVQVPGAVTARAIDLSGNGIAESLGITRRDDLMPEAVRVIYLTANVIDNETYRDGYIDHFPALGPTTGPRVLVVTIPLAGAQMQRQKSPVRTRTIPTSGTDAKAYLKKKFRAIRDVPDGVWSVSGWEKILVPPDDDEEDDHIETTINPNATRLQAADIDDLPRELVQGTVADWMRKKIGHVQIKLKVIASPSATDADRAALAKIPKGFQVVGTNAITKIYKGPSQWVPAEDYPVGLAEAYYESCTAAYQWEGSVSLVEQEAGSLRYHGCKINISGSSDTALNTMNAAVHSVDIEIDSGRTDIGFGPAPHLAPADILELQRQLRGRPVTWWSTEERDSNKLGSEHSPSAGGDTLTPYDSPETLIDADNRLYSGRPFEMFESLGGVVIRESTIGGIVPGGFSGGVQTFSGASGKLFGRLTINGTTGAVSSATIITAASLPANTSTQFHIQIGEWETNEADEIIVWNDRYGPVDANICRNWFAGEAPYFGVTFIGAS